MISYKIVKQSPEMDMRNLKSIIQELANVLESLDTVLANAELPQYQNRFAEVSMDLVAAVRILHRANEKFEQIIFEQSL